MRGSWNVRSLQLIALLGVLALPGNAFAGGQGDGAAGEGRLLNLVVPTAQTTPGTCSWLWQHNVSSTDNGADSDSGEGWGKYAHARSQGQQIWGYAWAKTNHWLHDPWTYDEDGLTGQNIYVTYNVIPDGCQSEFNTSWDPTFTASADVIEDAQALAYGYMWGDTTSTNLHPKAHGGQWRVDDDGGDVSMTYQNLGLPDGSTFNCDTTGPNPKAYSDSKWGHVVASNEKATFKCHCKVEAYADDDTIGYNYGECEAHIYASWPRLEIEAFCDRIDPNSSVTCSGGLTVMYGFPPP